MDRDKRQSESSADDATLTISQNETNRATNRATNRTTNRTSRSEGIAGALRAPVAIVTGEDQTLSSHQQELLRGRLRAAAIVILFGFGIYLVRSYFETRPLQGLHTLVVCGLMAAIALLVSSVRLSTAQLRWLELGIFGAPALFFVPYHYYCVVSLAQPGMEVEMVAIYKNVASYWFCLLVIYGIFVPNGWKRTAIIVSPMVILPVAVALMARHNNEFVREHLTPLQITDTGMILIVGALCAAYGAHVIHSLRREADEARQFGQYRLGALIGSGGMGEVYRAEHQLLKRPCAIKLIRPESMQNPAMLARFEREVQTTASLTHWNTIEIYDYGRTESGVFYYVMEYLPGMSLSQMLKRTGPLPPARVVNLLKQICAALSEAHSKAFIHRDITSGNIFVTHRGGCYDVAKLLDFGLVKYVSSENEKNVTQTGTFTGTPKYMSPEQASREVRPDARSDLYSLGVVAYVMLTGKPPFDGNSMMNVLIAHARDPVPALRSVNAGIPESLEKVILRCLEKHPNDRYQSAAELSAALESCELDDSWSQNDASGWWRELELLQHPTDIRNAVEINAPVDRKP